MDETPQSASEAGNSSRSGYQYPFQDPALGIEERIDSLIGLMTLEEKVQCLSTNPSVPRLGVKGSGHVEGLHGLALGGPGRWGRGEPIPTTTFPQAIGLAETWDPEAVRRVAAIEAREARYFFHHPRYQRGGLVVRAPNADLGRDPRWGRSEECYGEDAFFNATMAVAFVKGLQGDHPKYWQCASLLKHFLANSNEDGREHTSSDFDERLFREYYALTFQRAIQDGGSRAFMAAYNAHNGIPCHTHPMLKNITVDEWGQDGITCTDGGGFKLLVSAHKRYPDLYQAAEACLKAGINQFLDDFRESVEGAIERGLLCEQDVESVIRGNFRVMLRLGLWDPEQSVPFARVAESEPEPYTLEAHKRAVREVTRQSIVLLKNSNGLLPLATQTRWRRLRKLALIGPLADQVHIDWYSGTPPYLVTPLEGIRQRVGADVEVIAVTNNDTSAMIKAAREADVCIVCVGNHPTGDAEWATVTRPSYGKEAVDRRSLDLEEERVVKTVFEHNTRTILVLISSFPYAINWSQGNVPAIVHMTHNSQELGHALADVLFGDYNPAGRLVQTWPKSLDQLPEIMDYDLRHGRTYMYSEHEPLYPFGFGLSYTNFAYGGLRLSSEELAVDGCVTVSVEVTNTGKRAGEEVVQLYVRHQASAVSRPLKELKGFKRVSVEPGQTHCVEIELRARDLAYWDTVKRAMVVEVGTIEVMLGRSSSDIVQKRALRVGSPA